MGSEKGIWVTTIVSITVHPLSWLAPFTSYGKFVLSGNSSSRILVSLVSWGTYKERVSRMNYSP